MKLTSKNYFTPKNKYLSASKLKDWIKDKRHFYEKHILHTIQDEPSLALDIGQAVDCYVMRGQKAFHKQFKCVERRNLKEPPTGYIQLNQNDFSMAIAMSEKVRSQQAFKELQGYKTQQILQVEKPIGKYFIGLCGIPDWIKIESHDDGLFWTSIADLKTTADINPFSYHRSCENFGYYRQAAFYCLLAEAKMTGGEMGKMPISCFENKHLVVEKDRDGVYLCKTFILSPERIDEERRNLIQIINEIAYETKFEASNASWKDAVTIGVKLIDKPIKL